MPARCDSNPFVREGQCSRRRTVDRAQERLVRRGTKRGRRTGGHGAGRVFSAGVDLRRVLDGGRAYTDRLVPALSAAFTALFAFPGPTVAAINGAAVAGGCVLACACDRRLILSEAPIGASELRVGVPFPVVALEILRHACGDQAEEVILEGQLHQGREALPTTGPHACGW